MRYTEIFALHPAQCMSCGTSEGPGVDFERFTSDRLSDEVRIYMCQPCAEEMLDIFHFVPAEQYEQRRREWEAMQSELVAANERVTSYQDFLRAADALKLVQTCVTCDWVGKSLAQKIRTCQRDECPHQTAKEVAA